MTSRICGRATNAEMILIDVPIGLREEDNTPQACDREAKEQLGPLRSSVFPTWVRGVLEAESYEDAREARSSDGQSRGSPRLSYFQSRAGFSPRRDETF
ncbi:hypothetical protein BRC92_08590 [Halobacteriales archaeon QS_4_69_31]|nr:MAG: hypothetical protein BRC92_08590 [Halobacteriales archaeon QS_4_69_31]